jgi:hypothetical protein
MEFIPPGREQIEGGNLVISPDHTLETIHVTGIYGHSSGKPNFSPEPLVVATLTSESLKEVILNFIDQLLG